jgi:hypothetical protein
MGGWQGGKRFETKKYTGGEVVRVALKIGKHRCG